MVELYNKGWTLEEWAVKYNENNEAVSSDICTRSEGGGDVEWNKGEGNETISNKLTVSRSILDLGNNNNL